MYNPKTGEFTKLSKKVQKLYDEIKNNYDKQADPRYGAARMWVDEIIDPRKTRDILIQCLSITSKSAKTDSAKYGVLQV